MRVLDLFCGLGGWGRAFRDRGHEVVGVDIKDFGQEVIQDVFDFPGHEFMGIGFDFIAASPPCEAFSVASIGTHWGGGLRAYEPKTEHAIMSIRMVDRTLDIIEEFSPRAWVIENPRGVLRKLGMLENFERNTVTFCAYGDSAMKPTDLWADSRSTGTPAPCARTAIPATRRRQGGLGPEPRVRRGRQSAP
jgi:hypothetical protein